jgi:phage shock protein PspC (stress-responsive transcriptional regulator)
MTKKLKRSQTNRMLTGVCGGIAEYLKVDATLIRVAFVVASILGVGAPGIIYIILVFIMPDEL